MGFARNRRVSHGIKRVMLRIGGSGMGLLADLLVKPGDSLIPSRLIPTRGLQTAARQGSGSALRMKRRS